MRGRMGVYLSVLIRLCYGSSLARLSVSFGYFFFVYLGVRLTVPVNFLMGVDSTAQTYSASTIIKFQKNAHPNYTDVKYKIQNVRIFRSGGKNCQILLEAESLTTSLIP